MVTGSVGSAVRNTLQSVFDQVVDVSPLLSNSRGNLTLLGRPDLLYTFTKLQLWTLTQFDKVVFLDADTCVLANVDDLFLNDDELAASPDMGWPDCFNSGVFVARPSQYTYEKLLNFAAEHGSFDGGDQGLLNDFFPNWKRLPFVYNVGVSASYSYLPAYKRYGNDVKIIHFAGVEKPWLWNRYSGGGVIARGQYHYGADLVQKWWNIFDKHFGKDAESMQQLSALNFNFGGHNGVVSSGSGTGHTDHQHDNAPSSPSNISNPFFGSRYNWDEKEFGKLKGKGTIKMKYAPKMEDDIALPLKKPMSHPMPPMLDSSHTKFDHERQFTALSANTTTTVGSGETSDTTTAAADPSSPTAAKKKKKKFFGLF